MHVMQCFSQIVRLLLRVKTDCNNIKLLSIYLNKGYHIACYANYMKITNTEITTYRIN